MAVETDFRYPDVAVYCGNPMDIANELVLAFDNPVVVIEVRSATAPHDIALPSLKLISPREEIFARD